MIRVFHPDSVLPPTAGGTPTAEELRQAVWVDLAYPTPAEYASVEAAFGIRLPTDEDMREIEASSRIYRERGASYMTVLMVVGLTAKAPAAVPVGLVLTPSGTLVTVRHADLPPFQIAAESRPSMAGGVAMLIRLFDIFVDRTADILEAMAAEIDRTSELIFDRGTTFPDARLSPANLQKLLRAIGHVQFVVNKVHESLLTLRRANTFLNLVALGEQTAKDQRSRHREMLKSLSRDIDSLNETAAYLMQNVNFLLDAAVGRISIEQNIIIKLFSLAAIVLMPPTLIAGIYGMNFTFMPELDQRFGYPAALLLMLLSAVLPLWYCRRKGWL